MLEHKDCYIAGYKAEVQNPYLSGLRDASYASIGDDRSSNDLFPYPTSDVLHIPYDVAPEYAEEPWRFREI